MNPFARLGKKSLAGAKRSADGRTVFVGQVDLDAGADGIAVTSSTLQPQGHEVMIARQDVSHESDAWSGAIGHPHVKGAVEIPIDDPDRSTIIGEVQPGDGRDVGECGGTGIEETTVSLPPTE